MIRFYNNNKADMNKIKEVSLDYFSRYKFEYASIREAEKEIGIRVSVYDEGANKGTGEYFDIKTLQPKSFTSNTKEDGSYIEDERKRYDSVLKDDDLKQLLKLYVKTNPRAIKITSQGVFFALGDPIKHSYPSDAEAGVFIPFNQDFNKGLIIKKIEENVFLYETVVN